MPEHPPTIAVGEQIREYKILEQISESDIESVYRAMHIFLDEERAFKVIRTQVANDPGFRDRFIHEAKVFSKLRHRNLVRLYEFGTLDETTFFVVFEYVQGETVGSRIRSKGKVPYWDAIRMIREIAEGLQVAHKQNLIHNNFSADCFVLVSTPEGIEITKLINFSLARNRAETTGFDTGNQSNLEYSSPEAFTQGDDVDQRSDIYSLGVAMYQMISGAVPFQGTTPQELIDLHLKGEVQNLSEIPPFLNQVLKKALSKSKEERYSTLQDLIHDLNRVPPPETADTWSGDTMNLNVPEEFPPGLQLAQRYLIEQLIGKGGMGTVYKARDRVLNVPVALKSINKTITNSERMVERLKREVILARKVAHPNVCRIYDIGQTNGRHYVTMEYLEGKTLAEMLQERTALTTERGIPILKQLFLGLQEAHRVGVIHRDLKPQNIMVDLHGRAFLMDFGISISEEVRRLTESGIVIGTPWYMAPEQFSSSNVGVSSDIYSMGIIMFEMFTGRLPFDAKTPATVMNAHVEGALFKPSSVADVHPALEKVILKAVERDPVNRYQDIAQLLTDLEAAEDTPYASTLIVPRPVLEQESKTQEKSETSSPDQPVKPWQRMLQYFKK